MRGRLPEVPRHGERNKSPSTQLEPRIYTQQVSIEGPPIGLEFTELDLKFSASDMASLLGENQSLISFDIAVSLSTTFCWRRQSIYDFLLTPVFLLKRYCSFLDHEKRISWIVDHVKMVSPSAWSYCVVINRTEIIIVINILLLSVCQIGVI